MGNIDCVWKLSAKSRWGNHEELKYSIRSVVKHFKDLHNVVIIGTKPSWLSDKAIFIPADDPYKNKDSNIIRKLVMISENENITENFLNCSNDQLAVHSFSTNILIPWTIDSDLRRLSKGRGVSVYGRRVINTVNTLKKEGLPTHCYEGHIFYLINKEKYNTILAKYDFTKGNGMVGNSLYFNNVLDNGENPVENFRAFLKRSYTMGQIIDECRGKLFLGYQKRALNENLKNFLKQRFPEKSIYEK